MKIAGTRPCAPGIAKIVGNASITLVGFKKDHTSSYLDHFPGWHLHEVEPESEISATRPAAYLLRSNRHQRGADRDRQLRGAGGAQLPEAGRICRRHRQCAAEHKAVMVYRAKYSAAVHLTADCVVTCSDHVLLIKRGGDIGNGLWACPGGYLELRERFYEAAVRELAEETGLDPLPARMRVALRGQAIFDHPGRSARGRIITTAFHFDFADERLPEVEGKDDAARARWVPIAELPQLEEQLFEDHACILDHFLGVFRVPSYLRALSCALLLAGSLAVGGESAPSIPLLRNCSTRLSPTSGSNPWQTARRFPSSNRALAPTSSATASCYCRSRASSTRSGRVHQGRGFAGHLGRVQRQ